MKYDPDNSLDIWESQQRVLTSLTEDKMTISKINRRTCLSEVGRHSTGAVVQKCEIAPSEDDLETPDQFG
jgi:hypothetical protein